MNTTSTQSKIGYKKLRNNLIAELEILGDNNENRSDIVDSINAKYRCSKVRVLSIKDYDGKAHEEGRSLYNGEFIYKVGEIIETEYDKDIDKVCSSGIHYFLSYERAEKYEANMPLDFTGCWVYYYDNGQLESKCEYVKGKPHGLYEELYENGKISIKCSYENGRLHGLYVSWHNNGQTAIRVQYVKGLFDGIMEQWNSDGELASKRSYKNGILDGLHEELNRNGVLYQQFHSAVYIN